MIDAVDGGPGNQAAVNGISMCAVEFDPEVRPESTPVVMVADGIGRSIGGEALPLAQKPLGVDVVEKLIVSLA